MVSFFTQQKNRSFQASRGKFQNRDAKPPVNDSRSPIKKRPQPQRISSTVWAKMSQEAKDQFLQEKRESQEQQHGHGQRGRGGRGRGGRRQQRQHPEGAEAELVEAGTIECFNVEITQELSDMSELNHDNGTQISTASEGPEVLFTNAAESTCQKSTPIMQRDESPTIDSSSTTNQLQKNLIRWAPCQTLLGIQSGQSHSSHFSSQ
jgi:hypothetical protein